MVQCRAKTSSGSRCLNAAKVSGFCLIHGIEKSKSSFRFVEDDVLARNQLEEIRSSPRNLAEWLHNAYEDEAARIGWKTQKDCRVEFDKLPRENRIVMVNIAERIIELFREKKK